MIAVVILQRDIARIGRGGGNKLSNVRSFYHFAVGRGLNFLQYGNNSINFFGKKKKGKMKLSGVSVFLRTRAKTFSSISSSYSFSSSNLKLSINVDFVVPSNLQLTLH